MHVHVGVCVYMYMHAEGEEATNLKNVITSQLEFNEHTIGGAG